MKLRLLSMTFVLGCTATVSTPPPAQPVQPAPVVAPATVVVAPNPEKHPSYLRALADLRAARSYLARPAGAQVKWDENRAMNELSAAINEIHQAAVDDGKPAEERLPADAPAGWGDRLHKARELTEAARRDVNQEEDNAWANGLKNRAIGHIDLAVRAIDDGIADSSHMPPPVVVTTAPPPPVVVTTAPPPAVGAHPAYLHALTDLRMARALVEKPARPDVKWDEMNAVREIEGAINEIHQAAIDDGKPVADHPPVDMAMKQHDRLVQAVVLLEKSAQDIQQKEDNAFAKGLRKRAMDHIAAAIHDIRQAIEDRNKHK
jgi:hypothetical protein